MAGEEDVKKSRSLKRKESSSSGLKKSSKTKKTRRTKAPAPPPMPAEGELDNLFEQLLLNIGVGEEQKGLMRKMDKEQKWTMICQSKEELTKSGTSKPETYIDILKQPSMNLKNAETLSVCFRTESMAWLQKFIDLGGMTLFFQKFSQLLKVTNITDAVAELITEFTRSAKGLLNARPGLDAVTKTTGSLETIVLAIDFLTSDKMKTTALEVLAALCIWSYEAHRTIYLFTEPRFEKLLVFLKDDSEIGLKAAMVTFINALLHGIHEPRERIKLREKWNLVDLVEHLRSLKDKPDYKTLEPSLNTFDDYLLSEPELEEPTIITTPAGVTDEASENFTKLLDELKSHRSPAYPILSNLVEHLLLMSIDGQPAVVSWQTVDNFVQAAISVPTSLNTEEYAKAVCKALIGEEEEEEEPVPSPVETNRGEDKQIADEQADKITMLKGQVYQLKGQLEQLHAETETLRSRPPEVKVVTVEKVVEVEKIVEKVVEKIVEVPVPAAGGDGPAPVTGGPPPPPPPGGDAPAPVVGGPPPPPPPGGGPPPPPPPPGGGPPPPPPPPGGGPPPPPPPPGGGPPPPPPPPGGGPPGPPPPPGSGPPGPPPLPGMAAIPSRPKKKQLNPSTKMRGLAWAKIDDKKIDNTIWDKKVTDDSIVRQLDFKELEELFCAVQPPKPEAAGSGSGPSGPATSGKKVAVSLLDPKRSNNVSIMLSRFGKTPFADIRQAIMKLDEEFLNMDTTAALKQFVPEPEEVELLKEYSGDVSALARPEQFFLELLKIKALGPRLNSFHAKQGFDKKLDVARDSVVVLLDAVKEVKESKKLPRVLELVLGIGNFLNGGTFRGGAYGFKLETLNKITEVRGVDGKTNMLNYLAVICESKEQYKDLLNFSEDFPNVAASCRESIPQIQGDLGKLGGELKQVEGAIKTAPDDPSDPFKRVMSEFHERSIKRHEETMGMFNQLEKDYKAVLEYFGELPSTDSQSFFSNIHSFAQNFEKAHADNIRRKQLAEKQKLAEQRRKEMAEKLAAKKAAGGGDADADAKDEAAVPKKRIGGGNRNMLDNLIADMKTGQAFAPPSQGDVANEALAVFARLKKTNRDNLK